MIIGYARVSTNSQSTELQKEALKAAGTEKVFAENVSGAKFQRPQLHAAIDALQEGGTLLVSRLDRLARSLSDLFLILDRISAKGAKFRSLHEAWADTTTPQGRFMIAVIGGAAEFERELILGRVGEGRARAVAQGVKFGRPRKMTKHQRNAAIQMVQSGVQQAEVARLFSVSSAAICVMVREQAGKHHELN